MIRKLNLLFALTLAVTLLLASCGGGDDEASGDAGDAAAGQEQYARACAGCHGPNGEGIEGLGKAWTNSAFIKDSTDEELLAFVKKGRPSSDPLNTSGVDMPPKGGNPALTDSDILDIVAFMRTLQ